MLGDRLLLAWIDGKVHAARDRYHDLRKLKACQV